MRKFLFLVVSTFLIQEAWNAQTAYKDAGLWATVKLEKRINKFSLYLGEELRFMENYTQLGMFFTEIGGEYRFNKMIKLAAAYRLVDRRRLNGSYNFHQRYVVDLSIKKKFKPLVLIYRARFLNQILDFGEESRKPQATKNLRNKLTVKLDLGKRYRPYLAAEVFYQLNNNDRKEFDRARFYGGIEYEINKYSTIDFYYMHQREFNVKKPRYDYITGVSYLYSF